MSFEEYITNNRPEGRFWSYATQVVTPPYKKPDSLSMRLAELKVDIHVEACRKRCERIAGRCAVKKEHQPLGAAAGSVNRVDTFSSGCSADFCVSGPPKIQAEQPVEITKAG